MSDGLITKRALAQGLKELTKKKKFDKISVSDITNVCGLNRQTFYYHFQDKYELVNWIYYNEVIAVVIQNKTVNEWSDIVLEMLTIMKKEKEFYENALQMSGQNTFEEYIFTMIRELLMDLIGVLKVNFEVSEDDRKFIAEFYAYGLVGKITSWAKNGMKETPKSITEHLKHLVDDIKEISINRYLKETCE